MENATQKKGYVNDDNSNHIGEAENEDRGVDGELSDRN